MSKTEENKPLSPEGQMVKIPREYLIYGVRKAAGEIEQKMAAARLKYGNRYNKKNDYEGFNRRFGFNDAEKIWEEYHLINNKQSKQPAVIRKVLRLLGDMARYNAISRMREDLKKESPAKEG